MERTPITVINKAAMIENVLFLSSSVAARPIKKNIGEVPKTKKNMMEAPKRLLPLAIAKSIMA